jgi:hypothetical protein
MICSITFQQCYNICIWHQCFSKEATVIGSFSVAHIIQQQQRYNFTIRLGWNGQFRMRNSTLSRTTKMITNHHTITTHVAAAAAVAAPPPPTSFTNQNALPQPAPAVVGGFSFETMSGKTPLVATNPQATPTLFKSSNGFFFAAAPSTGGTSATTITTHVAAAVAAPPPLFGVSNTSTGGSGGTGGGSGGRIRCPKVK